MAEPREIPQLVTDLVDMTKEYARQETIEPAKKLGKAAGMSLLAGLLWSIGAILISVAGMRYLVRALPDTPLSSALGYTIAAVALASIAGFIMWFVTREDAKGK